MCTWSPYVARAWNSSPMRERRCVRPSPRTIEISTERWEKICTSDGVLDEPFRHPSHTTVVELDICPAAEHAHDAAVFAGAHVELAGGVVLPRGGAARTVRQIG